MGDLGRSEKKGKKIQKKGGNFVPVLCNVVGTLILAAVIFSCLPMTIPRFMGYNIYNVVSGSMEPEIPLGSIIYVKEAEPEEIQEGDVIAYQSNGSVIVHRVVENRIVEGEFTTKGDANEQEDMNAVDYQALVGKVAFHIPVIGSLMAIYAGNVGKAYLVCFAACGAMFNMLAGRLRERRREAGRGREAATK